MSNARAVPPVRHDMMPRTHPGLICCSALSGGIGLSTLCAMIGWEITKRGNSCSIVDVDFRAGGLDVLLGMENEPGMRFADVDAPLGHVEGDPLERGLPHWEGIGVLAHHPWDADEPQIWEVQAVLQGLLDVNDVVLVDCADGFVWQRLPELLEATQLVAVELTVLGLARANVHLKRIMQAAEQQGAGGQPSIIIVGFPARHGNHHHPVISVQEAEEYLGCRMIGTLRYDSRLARDLLEGFGIRSIPRGSRTVVTNIADRLQRSPDRVRTSDLPTPAKEAMT